MSAFKVSEAGAEGVELVVESGGMSLKVLSLDHTRSISDVKSYECFSLPCGLEVLTVDSTLDCERRRETDNATAAAALGVQVGSFSDPAEAQGLAHFLEHMVFMGSSKYEGENEYDSFIAAHGGDCNAYTEAEHTNYQFDVQQAHFPKALDIFANCFYAPKLSPGAIKREISAIQNEYQLAKTSDSARVGQCMCSSAHAGHILRQFSWGNRKSLQDLPASKEVDVHALLRVFHKVHYLPSNMKLVVLAPMSHAALRDCVVASFGHWGAAPPQLCTDLPVPSQSLVSIRPQKDCLASMGMPFGPGQLASVTRIVPIKTQHKLILRWQLPSQIHKYRSKTVDYLSHLCGHEGPGSLLSGLKKYGVASQLSFGLHDDGLGNNSLFSLMVMKVTLTRLGLANWMYVTRLVYDYLAMLVAEGPQQWIFDENCHIEKVKYKFQEGCEEDDLVDDLAVTMLDMHGIDRAHLLNRWAVNEWEPEEIKTVLACMTPDNARTELVSSAFKHGAGETEGDDDSGQWEDEDDGSDMDSEGDDDDSFDSGDDEDSEGDDSDSDDGDGKGGGGGGLSGPSAEEMATLFSGPVAWTSHAGLPGVHTNAAGMEVGRPPDVEEHFDTLSWTDAVPEELLQLWRGAFTAHLAATPVTDAELFSGRGLFSLPPVNPFMPTDVAVLAPAQPEVEGLGQVTTATAAIGLPTKAYSTAGVTIWHASDERFPLPYVETIMELACPAAAATPLSAALCSVVATCLKDHMTETLYMAEMAHLYSEIKGSSTGLTLYVSGFSDKVPLLLHDLTSELVDSCVGSRAGTDDSCISADTCRRAFDQVCLGLRNATLKAGDAATKARLCSLLSSVFSPRDQLTALEQHLTTPGGGAGSSSSDGPGKLHVDKVRKFARTLLGKCSVDALMYGNLSELGAAAVGTDLSAVLASPTSGAVRTDSKHKLPPVVTRLPLGRLQALQLAPANPLDKNACVDLYFQVGPYTVANCARLDILEQMLYEPFFDLLRTKKQLGYSVSCSTRQTCGVLGFTFRVTSSTHSPDTVMSSMLSFIHTVPKLLGDMSQEDWASNKAAAVSNLLTQPTSLNDAARDRWEHIEQRDYRFNQHPEEAAAMRGMDDRAPLTAFVRKHFLDAPTSRIMVYQVSGTGAPANYTMPREVAAVAASAAGQGGSGGKKRKTGGGGGKGKGKKGGSDGMTRMYDKIYAAPRAVMEGGKWTSDAARLDKAADKANRADPPLSWDLD